MAPIGQPNNNEIGTNNDFQPNQKPNPFEKKKFDPEIGVDENNGKKYNQRLVGKLSQTLRDYNGEQQEPDSDLNKYVLSMVISATKDALTPEDKKDAIKKLENGAVEETDSNEPQIDNENGEFNVNEEMSLPIGVLASTIIPVTQRRNKKIEAKSNLKTKPYQAPKFSK
jgi:hypothetical protein